MPKYDITFFRERYTKFEIDAPNEEAACIMARERIHKDGIEEYTWEDDPTSDACIARLIPEPKTLKLNKMVDKLRSWGFFVEEQKDAEGETYGYIVSANVDCADYDVSFELLPEEGEEITAETFLDMWQDAVRAFNADAYAWRWLKTLEDYEAEELIRSGLGYFDDFYRYLRKTVGDMTVYLRKLEAEE